MRLKRTAIAGIGLLGCLSAAYGQTAAPKRNVIIFIADGLRPGSVTATAAPTMLGIRQKGVFFANSHSMFPTFTTPNASAIATGHFLGDTGDFSNTIYSGYPVFNTGLFGRTAGTVTPFVENNQILSDLDSHFQGNYLTEDSLMAIARRNGYSTASIGKVGPVAIQDVTQTNAVNGQFTNPSTVIIDDATGSAAGIPVNADVASNITAAGLTVTPTPRNQPAGNNTTAGTLSANVGQQQSFVDDLTKAVLPAFQKAGKPFYVVYWSRDPDGSQHNQGDSLNKLSPGINGPTSVAAVTNADNNLKQILAYINSDPTLSANTDIFVTADHGFATISKHEIDNAGHFTASYAATLTYKDAAGAQEVNTGFLPVGFLAIDIAHNLNLPIFDPDSIVTSATGVKSYQPVDPTIAQQTATTRMHSVSGDALIGGTGQILNTPDAKVIIAANGGSDLIYVPSKSAALVQQIVTFLATQDYVGGIFTDDSVGPISGALPISSIGLLGITNVPTPTIVVNFKTFSLDPKDPLQTAVQIADSSLQEGQGMHGTLSRDNTFNNMAAIGPDFKQKYVDNSPVSNADIVPTIAQILGLPVSNRGKLQGRVITEALVGNPDHPTASQRISIQSPAAPSGQKTVLLYQTLGSAAYFDQATFSTTSTQAVAGPKKTSAYTREFQLDGSASVSSDGNALTYSWTLAPGSASASILRANTAQPVVQFSSGSGTYSFLLTVTDASGVVSTDTVSISYYGR